MPANVGSLGLKALFERILSCPWGTSECNLVLRMARDRCHDLGGRARSFLPVGGSRRRGLLLRPCFPVPISIVRNVVWVRSRKKDEKTRGDMKSSWWNSSQKQDSAQSSDKEDAGPTSVAVVSPFPCLLSLLFPTRYPRVTYADDDRHTCCLPPAIQHHIKQTG